MAQPQVTVEQVLHLLRDADTHIDSHNQAKVLRAIGTAMVQALLLVAQEVDQVADALAVLAELKQPEDAKIT